MNNTQFRRLVLDTPTVSKSNASTDGATQRGDTTPSALGSRMRSNIPMTPYVFYSQTYFSVTDTWLDDP